MPLLQAIDELYRAFPGPPPVPMPACPCCVDAGEKHTLDHAARTSLSADQLSRYAFKAMTTWGDADAYRYFLPRILALAASPEAGEWPGFDLEVIVGKMQLAGWATWPAFQRAAVDGYLRALLREACTGDGGHVSWPASEILAAITRLAGEDEPPP